MKVAPISPQNLHRVENLPSSLEGTILVSSTLCRGKSRNANVNEDELTVHRQTLVIHYSKSLWGSVASQMVQKDYNFCFTLIENPIRIQTEHSSLQMKKDKFFEDVIREV